MAGKLKHYEVTYPSGATTTVKLDSEDADLYKANGNKLKEIGEYKPKFGRMGMSKEESDKRRAAAEEKAAQPANKAAQPDNK